MINPKSANNSESQNIPGKPWYECWFDSPYYHLLYRHRDNDEAAVFLDRLVDKLKIGNGSFILDQACGRGRHALHLHKLGYSVTGIDISSENIGWCSKYEERGLEFFIHDMRKTFRNNYFDAVLSLFTSFGYFEQDEHHHEVVNAACESLKPGGWFVIDFLNTAKAVNTLVPAENRNCGEIQFGIERKFTGGFFVKNICVKDGKKEFRFEERVKGFEKKDFEELFLSSGMKPECFFGDYHLSEYDEMNSERLIVAGRK